MADRAQRRVRVLFVISNLGGGGSERILTALANHLAATHDVTVATLDAGATDTYGLSPHVQRLVRTRTGWRSPTQDELAAGDGNEPRASSTSVSLIKRALGVLSLQVALWRLFRQQDPDVIVAFIARTILRCRLVSGRIPVIGAERTDPRVEVRSRGQRLAERILYPRLGRLVVQTGAAAQWAHEVLGLAEVSVLPNPVRIPPDTATPEASRTAVAMGRLIPSKGHGTALRAFAAIDAPDWRLTIVGQGPRRESLERLARTLGVADRVHLPGWQTDVEEVLRKSGVFVSASRIEGFPNALLEAMAAGLPSVVMDCPSGPSDLVTDGITGFLVPVDDEDLLQQRLEVLLRDPGLRKQMGAAARQAAQHYRLDRIADDWQDLIMRTAIEAG